MTRTLARLAMTVFVAGSSALAFPPIALAEPATVTTTSVTPTVEGWYQPNPSCPSPVGCLTTEPLPAQPPATSPFPPRSLHVGVSAGQETARSYLALPFSSVVDTISAASLNVPLDAAPVDGSAAPDTAKVQVCLTSATIRALDGSIDPLPQIDCDTPASAKYVATPVPHLFADLSPLIPGLAGATGLALLPTTASAPTDTWRVVFSAHDRTDAAKTPPATVTLTVNETLTVNDQPSIQPEAPAPSVPDGGIPDLTTTTPPVVTGFALPPPVATPGTGAVPDVATPVGVVAAPTTQPRTVTVGYPYPGVWLLPLAFLVLIPLIGRTLTTDLTP